MQLTATIALAALAASAFTGTAASSSLRSGSTASGKDAPSSSRQAPQRPAPVAQLNVSQYTGRWFQMYTDPLVVDTFEQHSACDTADYTALADGTIAVRNCDLNTTSGQVDHIDGIATVPDATQPGKLLVKFTDGTALPFPAPYWVMKLGPVRTYPAGDQYAYSIVADSLLPLGTLFVLGRDAAEFAQDFDAEVQAEVRALGFDLKFNDLVKTWQGDNCTYAPPAAARAGNM